MHQNDQEVPITEMIFDDLLDYLNVPKSILCRLDWSDRLAGQKSGT